MNIIDAFKIAKNKGPEWILFRTGYEMKRRTGIMKKRFIIEELSDSELINKVSDHKLKTKSAIVDYVKLKRSKFFFQNDNRSSYHKHLTQKLNKDEKENLINIADDAIEGKILCFSKWKADYGYPINWNVNPITKYEWPMDRHWVEIEELSKGSGDVKYVWEASRFPQIYYFIRAYTLTNNDKYAKAYWEQIESWIEGNPYNMGINWKCGQEVSFRMFSWIFGLYVFLDSPESTENRIFNLVKNLYQSAIRIEHNIDFAIKAVQNNHSISEAAGLFTFGILFPFFKDSKRISRKGKKYLEQEGLKQIYGDGSYIQNSMNYHRLMLQDYAWCYSLANTNDVKFSTDLTKKIKESIEFLYQMQNKENGRLPNYGANDGALIFPLTSCDYLDYRPQLNTINYIINGDKLYESGIHDEELLWFCGLDSVGSKLYNLNIRESKDFKIGGYYTFRGYNSFGMIRCVNNKHQGPADMLHFDFWYKGVNVLCDTGSYSYNTRKKLKDYFRSTKSHNTITINDEEQMKRGPRFLVIDSPKGYVNQYEKTQEEIYFSGYHDAYKNRHTREIIFMKDHCIIKDKINNLEEDKINIKLNWNIGTTLKKIGDSKYGLKINDKESIKFEISSITNGKIELYYGDEEKPAGWKSLYYGEKTPMNQLVYEIESREKEEEIVTKIFLK